MLNEGVSECTVYTLSHAVFAILQKWEKEGTENRLRNKKSKLCIDSAGHDEKGLTLNICDTGSYTQFWMFEMTL